MGCRRNDNYGGADDNYTRSESARKRRKQDGEHDDNYGGGDDNYAREIQGSGVEGREEGPGCNRQK
jgi:hypothetical protein